ncbi:MAG: hypothetical protein K8F91_00495 [Candidatus Obscuribacterales bacterium]|nr:hypothetical protein [Candidatus Obscuribacterales bacterium]
MRIDQYAGLNAWAKKTVAKREEARIEGTMTFRDGRRRRFTRWARVPAARVKVIGAIKGAWNPHVADLRRFEMPDGTVYVEFVQADIWCGGPIWHTALKNAKTGKPVKESLWTKEELGTA